MAAACPPEFVALAERLADRAGEIVRSHFRRPAALDLKPDASPVTEADREAEQAMRELIRASFPDHGVIGEEFAAERADADHVWVLDPIDGTAGFVTGEPVFGTLVALTHRGVPILGVIDQPISRERWLGARGRATTLNDAPARTRACPDIGRAALYTTGPEWFTGPDEAAFRRLSGSVGLCRYGADCYAFGLLASGFVDFVVETGMGPHDFCALVPVVEGAGGVVTDWRGRPLTTASDGRVLASGDRAGHAAALALLAGAEASS